MDRFEIELAQALAAVRAAPGWEARGIVAEPAIPVLASPSWRGVDGAPWRVVDKSSGESLFVKIMDPDAALYIDVACAFEAAHRASDLGIGPMVVSADPASGVLVMEDLNAGWRVGTLDRMLDRRILDAALAARKAFQEGPPLSKSRGVFEEIEHFHAAVTAAAAALPTGADWLLAELRFAAAEMKGASCSPVPIHGDGNVSNLLISEAGEVRLIDWDRATNADPLEDLGSFLIEAFDHEPDAWEAFVRHTGGRDDRAFNRARIFAIADDLRWGLIGALLAARSPRKTQEFYKFANWRFLRCRMAVRDPRFGEALRRIR
jgi:Phosphotransferase enzyme family